MRLQKIWSVVILAALSACVWTHSVEAPDQVDTYSSFLAVVAVEIAEDYPTPLNGHLGVLVPIGWEADSVTYTGPNSGSMSYSGWIEENLENWYPSSSSDHWIGFISDSSYPCNQGDKYEITVTIHTDSTLGFVDIAFLGMGSLLGHIGYPCSTTVEVVELNLEQSTWGSIKSDFRFQ